MIPISKNKNPKSRNSFVVGFLLYYVNIFYKATTFLNLLTDWCTCLAPLYGMRVGKALVVIMSFIILMIISSGLVDLE